MQPCGAGWFSLAPSPILEVLMGSSPQETPHSSAPLPGSAPEESRELWEMVSLPFPVPSTKAPALVLQGEGRCFNYYCLLESCGN